MNKLQWRSLNAFKITQSLNEQTWYLAFDLVTLPQKKKDAPGQSSEIPRKPCSSRFEQQNIQEYIRNFR